MLAFADLRLLAHQGGWDELIVLIAPVLLFAVIRVLEKRRRPSTDEDEPPAPGLNGTAASHGDPASRAPGTEQGA